MKLLQKEFYEIIELLIIMILLKVLYRLQKRGMNLIEIGILNCIE
jgi:hypothetical protein